MSVSGDPHTPGLSVSTDDAGTRLQAAGPLTLAEVSHVHAQFQTISDHVDVTLDMAGVERFDTAGAWAICSLRRRLESAGGSLRIEGARDAYLDLLKTVDEAWPVEDAAPPRRPTVADRLERLGRAVHAGLGEAAEVLGYFGLFLVRLFGSVFRPRDFRFTALVHHCEDVGLRAVPIVALMAFLIGIVLAFQGAAQLRQFGAEVFVVDLIAVSILRELGILLTAIIVAGRTASSFTATIGSMKMREEVDAMRTLGIDPAVALIVPRVLALLITLPILGLIANLAGLFGGALMSWLELGISPAMFRTRLLEGTDVSHVFVGLSKAPVFALIIGIVGCHAGMQVKGNAESLGLMTSKAVVVAIFAVIVADAMFSIFFAEVGL